MNLKTAKIILDLGLDPKDFISVYDFIDPKDFASSLNLTNRTVLTDPKSFGPRKENCLFKATGGFGCGPNSRGHCVFVNRLSDGVQGRIERYDVIAVRTLEADLVAADQAIGAARQALDQARRWEWKGNVMPADHPLIAAYNYAATDYENARLAWSAAKEAAPEVAPSPVQVAQTA
jgi:hypothetical protein